MANAFTTFQVRANEAPIQDMSFFLFLAETIVNGKELVTPIDLQQISDNELSNSKDHDLVPSEPENSEQEANHE
ncbi:MULTISPECIES: hypothetical protein [unclassified Oleiphilus]|jgi:hypothetical protein|uniref:hypothetical protein n=1 Tax=unclassified Oleiphilus TaxID=2631174 RepID=UPI0007C36F08|nr:MULTISPECIES: hypothetical protein [unclassified Oleiphilus]KZY45442.1 hypothetical protein A3732_10345 [Oleiphilus sp. HI0050]KZY75923.1 hypothetical protein A3741_23710 [Oleiphilus sp. HI0069]KZY78280.1 hypothetical protein A3740_01005 [Oleiphilus sp. HI0068]KZY89044.1 hypothetical protein A3743_09435 [Oleiphilus sp. HI0072]KZZ12050.1 hypothetical protein A3749_07300 [Oleiphilus sp. HI0078]KZZ21492.1 hypothetical protein A3752_01005 [Oleiphilus sp. HI0081]KZZ33511.1 hypothetical protein